MTQRTAGTGSRFFHLWGWQGPNRDKSTCISPIFHPLFYFNGHHMHFTDFFFFGPFKLVLPWQASKHSWKHPSIRMDSSEGFSLDSVLEKEEGLRAKRVQRT